MPNTPMLPPAPPPPSKQDVLAHMLGAYPLVRVMFDPTHPEIQGLPAPLRQTACQAIDIGFDLPKTIPDLTVDALGVSATLSFRGAKVWTMLPWQCVFALQPDANPGSGVLWTESVPEVLFRRALRAKASPPTEPGGATVFDLDSRRSPRDLHACKLRRMGVPTAAPPQGPAPTGGRAA